MGESRDWEDRARQRSSGTRKEVEGWKVRMRRRPCSGLSFRSSSRGSFRKRLLRPPSFPSSASACAEESSSNLRLQPCRQEYFFLFVLFYTLLLSRGKVRLKTFCM